MSSRRICHMQKPAHGRRFCRRCNNNSLSIPDELFVVTTLFLLWIVSPMSLCLWRPAELLTTASAVILYRLEFSAVAAISIAFVIQHPATCDRRCKPVADVFADTSHLSYRPLANPEGLCRRFHAHILGTLHQLDKVDCGVEYSRARLSS